MGNARSGARTGGARTVDGMRAAFVRGKGQRIDGAPAHVHLSAISRSAAPSLRIVQNDFTKTILIVDCVVERLIKT